MQPPLTPIVPVIDVIHGKEIIDNYRWLEIGSDPQVEDWVKAQNSFTDAIFANNTNVSLFHDELVKNFDTEMFNAPVPFNGKYFWTERKPNEEQHSLYMKNGLDGEPIKLIDPTSISATTSLDYWYPSPTGKYIAYGLSQNGDEMATMYLLNVDQQENEKDTISRARHARLVWLPDESGFYYTRHPDIGTVDPTDEQYYEKAYIHILGHDYHEDELIFGEGRPKEDMLSLHLTTDADYLFITAMQNWDRNDVYVYDCQNKTVRPLLEGLDNKFTLGLTNDKVLLKTNYKTQNNRMLYGLLSDLPEHIDEWKEFVPETDAILDSFRVTAHTIIVMYMKDACSLVKLFDHSGNEKGILPLPSYSDITGIGARREEEEFFFGVTTFLSPKTVFHSSDGGINCTVYRTSHGALSEDVYHVSYEWTASKDGTQVPVFIVHKKDIQKDGTNPTILYGYGGHGTSQRPSFLRSWIPWLERGGIYAVAIIRGGGEYGVAWQRAGSRMNKQNTFDDFIAISEYLINENYTSADHLGILGGSNGGLMVGSVMIQRPDLFKAVVCRVPILDITRFHKFLIASRWVTEFGNPDIQEEFEYLIKWSPYHNVKEGVQYPNVLFTTANNDTRVDPLHARKMTALLQEQNKSGVTMLRTEMDAGHGVGRSFKKRMIASAEVLSFFAWQLSLHM